MQKIKVQLPATLTHFAPSLDTLGLAIGLYTQVEFSRRDDDDDVVVEAEGEGKKHYKQGQHPVVLGMERFFEHIKETKIGVNIKVKNDIPIECGLGAETAFTVAGIVGANILLGNRYHRTALIPILAKLTKHSDGAIASFIGGLASSIQNDDELDYRALPIKPFRMIVAIPEVRKFKVDDFPSLIAQQDMRDNIRHTIMLQQALAEGDLSLLAKCLKDPIDQFLIQSQIPKFEEITKVARSANALAITTTGRAYGMIFFAQENHLSDLQSVIEEAFTDHDISAQVMTLPVDTQGVVISVMQSA